MKKLCFAFAVILLTITQELIAQWVQTNGPYGGANVNALAISGSNLIAAIFDGGGVYLSTDKGSNWISMNSEISTPYIITFAVSDSNVFAGGGGRIYRSTNAGVNWTEVNHPEAGCHALALNGSDIFNAVELLGVYRSTDNGESWLTVNNGLPKDPYDSLYYEMVEDIIVCGTSLFVGTYAGVYRSTNNGSSWVEVNNGIPKNPYDTAKYVGVNHLETGGNNLYAFSFNVSKGIFRSTDNGEHWTTINTGLIDNAYISALGVSENSLFAGTRDHISLSTNNGDTWTQTNADMKGSEAHAFAIDGTDILVGTGGAGILHSTSDGDTWNTMNCGLNYSHIPTIIVKGASLFAGTQCNGVFLSSDEGDSWINVDSGLANNRITTLVVKDENLFGFADAGQVFRSTNNGTHWTLMNGSVFSSTLVTSVIVNGANLFVGTSGKGVLLSSDDGTSWAVVNNGITDLHMSALAANDTYLFAAAGCRGIFRSSNSGGSWVAIDNNIPKNPYDSTRYLSVNALVIKDSSIFAGIGTYYVMLHGRIVYGGVFHSTDNGKNWVDAGLDGVLVQALALSDTNLFAMSDDGRVFLSRNNGKNWTRIAPDSSQYSVQAMAVKGDYLFAGTLYSGVWKERLSDMVVGVRENKTMIPERCLLAQNYPNPFNPTTTISFDIPHRSLVSLKIYDILGREVATLASEEMAPGNYTRQWDAGNLASGIYFYRLQAGSFGETKKLVLLK